ncbi:MULTISPECIES: DUF3105 domain-containing protein [Streptosporangium]|uniref:DUF3105 domain-containing protein n=1 Tax=Streptosporangium brasiliense TaxID=47480 RepID=A0ABT9REZ1_9ACTN|nr:DUF3105 domain-containing protein [Streptosporangium brasiliense]MDP9867843.1 hypothetical protein [Streptosporangium brasiliense]
MSGDARATIKQRLATVRAQQRRRTIAVTGAAVVVFGGITAAATVLILQERSRSSLDAVQTIAVTQREHTTGPVTYPQSPPVGGDHDPAWQNCGIYRRPLRAENVVHAQEHGAVWITYRPDLPRDQVEELLALTRGRDYVIVSPFPGLAAPVVASAWTKQLTLDGVDDPRLPAFLRAHIQGPATPEPGASCSGGIGEPSA